MNTVLALIVLVGIAYAIWFRHVLKTGKTAMVAPIPGDGLKPIIPPDGMPMPNMVEQKFAPPKRVRRYRYYTPNIMEKNGVKTNWGVAKAVFLNYFANGSALIINERGNPQRISRKCLQVEYVS